MPECVLCGKSQKAERMHRTFSTHTRVTHWYCKDLIACDRRRGVIASRKAA